MQTVHQPQQQQQLHRPAHRQQAETDQTQAEVMALSDVLAGADIKEGLKQHSNTLASILFALEDREAMIAGLPGEIYSFIAAEDEALAAQLTEIQAQLAALSWQVYGSFSPSRKTIVDFIEEASAINLLLRRNDWLDKLLREEMTGQKLPTFGKGNLNLSLVGAAVS